MFPLKYFFWYSMNDESLSNLEPTCKSKYNWKFCSEYYFYQWFNQSIKTFQTELYSKNLNHPKNTITFYRDLCFALEESHVSMTMIVCRTQHMEHHRQPCGHRVRAGSYCWLRPAWRGGQRRYGERWHVSRYVMDMWHSIEPAVQYF